jgi:tetratricopeptide (TPR) repeat protein
MAETERARELLAEANDIEFLLIAQEQIGWGGWWHGDLDSAEAAWSEMRRLAHEHGWPSREAEALIHLNGVAAQRGGRRVLLDQARELAAAGPSRLTRARVSRQVGVALAAVGKDDEALAELLSSAAILDEFGDSNEAHSAYFWAGRTERYRGRLPEALGHFEKARTLVLGHVGYLPEIERNIAQVLLDMGDIPAAAEHA